MPKVELSVSSLICILLGVQIFVSLVVIGQFNNFAVRSWADKMSPSGDKDHTLGTTNFIKTNDSQPLLVPSIPSNKSQEFEMRLNSLQAENAILEEQLQKRTPRSDERVAETERPYEPAPPANGFVILTSVNAEFVDIAENWLESIRRLGLRYNITVVAEDEDTYKYFSIRSNKEFRILYQKQYAFNFTRRYGPVMMYQELIRRRTVYIKTLLEQGNDVLLVDVDTVWVKNPVDLVLREYPVYDMWLAQGYENHIPCPCFMYMKATPGVVALVREWVKRLENQRGRRLESDQVALTKVLPLFPDIPAKKMSFEKFPTGKHYFDRSWLALHQDEVYVAHGNHLGRHDAKKKKLKEFGLWLLNS